MKKQTTDATIKELLSKRGVFADLKVKPGTARMWRKRLAEGKLDESKKEKILRMAGYAVVQERLWGK